MHENDDCLESYFIDEEKANARYADVLVWFCSRAPRFSLSCRDGVDWSLRTLQVIEELEPFLVAEVRRNWWPGCWLKDSSATIYIYRCAPEAAWILSKSANRFDDWLPPDLPEDLVFYRANDYWMFRFRTIHSALLSIPEYEEFETDFPGFLIPYSSVP